MAQAASFSRLALLVTLLAACGGGAGGADAGLADIALAPDVLADAAGDAGADAGADAAAAPFADPAWFAAEQGRVLVLRGINVISAAKGDPERLARIDAGDARRVARDWGFDFVRFLVFWDAIEPAPGVYDETYLQRVEERLDLLHDEGLWVMLDMHQDVYARKFCCDGAPEWAIRDDDLPFQQREPWFLNYFEPAVQRAFDHFWAAEGPHADLQEHYAGAWVAVAERLGRHPAVIGYDLMNEPHPGSDDDITELLLATPNPDGPHAAFDREKLQPFHQRLIDRIRAVDTEGWIFFEPRYGAPGNGLPSYAPPLVDPRPGPARVAYAPHLYSLPLDASHAYDPAHDPVLANWEERRAAELAAQPMALLLGEWGLDWRWTNAGGFSLGVVDMADRMRAGWAYWSYDPGGWGLWDRERGEQPNAAWLVRPYPRAVAGVPLAWAFDRETRVFTLTFEERPGARGPTEIALPARRLYPDGWDVSTSDADGTWSWAWDAAREILSVTTPATGGTHTLELRPAPPACTPADQAPGDGPSGYAMDGWAWERLGEVLPRDERDVAALDGDLAPALVATPEGLALYFTRKQGLEHRLWRAASADGRTWSAPAPLTGLGDDTVIAAPTVVWEDGRYRMWFASGAIYTATSDDGLAWTVAQEPALSVGEAGAFDQLGVLYPRVLREIGRHSLWYAGYDGTRFAIGRATSLAGERFYRTSTAPVLPPGGPEAFDNTAVAQTAVLWTGSRLLLWYGGYDTSRTDPGPYRIGLATSPDGATWTKRGVTLDLPPAGVEAFSTRDPAVLRWDGGLLMAYAGMGDDRRYRLLAAHTSTCLD